MPNGAFPPRSVLLYCKARSRVRNIKNDIDRIMEPINNVIKRKCQDNADSAILRLFHRHGIFFRTADCNFHAVEIKSVVCNLRRIQREINRDDIEIRQFRIER